MSKDCWREDGLGSPAHFAHTRLAASFSPLRLGWRIFLCKLWPALGERPKNTESEILLLNSLARLFHLKLTAKRSPSQATDSGQFSSLKYKQTSKNSQNQRSAAHIKEQTKKEKKESGRKHNSARLRKCTPPKNTLYSISMLKNKRCHDDYDLRIRRYVIYSVVTIVNNTSYIFKSC